MAILFILLSVVVAASVHGVNAKHSENVVPHTATRENDFGIEWWENAVFYQIYPRSFKDSNNDGIGDLKGIIEKLDFLADTGITAVWLSPIFKSPQVDQGYDISDYYDVDEDYGTLEDLRELVDEAHKRGIKIILDFVPNHTSNQHQWFKDSVSDPTGDYGDFYVWKDCEKDDDGKVTWPNNWLSFFGGSAWQYNEVRKQCYLHQFAPAQPDLNYNNDKVVEAMKDVLKFWLKFGVDGFRCDAVLALFEDPEFKDEPRSNTRGVTANEYGYLDHIYTVDQPQTFDMIYQWRDVLDEFTYANKSETKIMMTEAYTGVEKTMLYYGLPDGSRKGAHFAFNFNFITSLKKGFNFREFASTIEKWFVNVPKEYTSNWVLGNHDNRRVATRFGPELVDGLNMVSAFLPGVMVTYNGEEIGMEDGQVTCEEGYDPQAIKDCATFNETSRDFERTPYQWDNSTNAGFNDGSQPWLPVSDKYKEVNLAAQNVAGAPSHYNLYKSLVAYKNETFATDFSNLDNLAVIEISMRVVQIIRQATYDQYILVFNTADGNETVRFYYSGGYYNVELASNEGNYKVGDLIGNSTLSLKPYECIVLRQVYLAGGPSVAYALPYMFLLGLGALMRFLNMKVLIFCSVLFTVGVAITGYQLKGDGPNSDWWKTAVFYQIYPRSFMDSDGDGIGDIQGIIQKLHHLQDAGITATWLSPIFSSPQVDQGYDISDYRNVDPDYGTLEDLKQLLDKAKELGIKLILDFVPNHTSDQHEWFKKSVAKEEGYEDFYVWHDGNVVNGTRQPPNNWLSEFQGPAWTFNEDRQQYYYHEFAPQQPDLNYANPVVVEAMKDVLRYWLDFGVDGFRVDAVPHLFEDPELRDEPLIDGCTDATNKNCLDHIYTKGLPETYDLIYQFRDVLDNFTETNNVDTRVMMTEAYDSIEKQMLYYGNVEGTTNGAHFTFNFVFISNLQRGFQVEDIVDAIKTWLSNIPTRFTSNWVLGNHDNHRVATRLGKENVDGLNMLTAILPGVMVTYNGEEIGMEDGEVTCEQGHDPQAIKDCSTFDQTSRDFERTPFQWDGSTNAGFTNGTPWLPVSTKSVEVNLAAQDSEGEPTHYNLYKELMEFRKNFQGDFTVDTSSPIKVNETVLQVTRRVDNDEFILLFNVGDEEQSGDFYRTFARYEIVVGSSGVSYKKGDPFEDLKLSGHEAVILHGIGSNGGR
ncbi:hypothetical protein NQ315_002131 [Exocentrus adspersus]|uniref:alpha-glucosidase n=1 Tax=Exocentrus adspersus TaxID=1586481 RepID=A0AAV8VZ33_9CUCU|nr:hypothetical protein NQ315_002131 [Exocentrus adspersus]